MNLRKGLYRFIAKILVWVMAVQGIPFWQISRSYSFELDPGKLAGIACFLASSISPPSVHAGVAPDPQAYFTNRIPNNFVDISGTGTSLVLGGEGGVSGVPLGFGFNFYGTLFTSITITANGYLSFASLISPDNEMIPSKGLPQALIAPFWDDLDPALNPSSGIFYQTIGAPPLRRFIVQYDNIPLAGDPGSRLTFQAVLFETSNEIQFHYLSLKDGSGSDTSARVTGGSASVGIENQDGTRGNEIVFNLAGGLGSGSAFSFTRGGTSFKTGHLLGDLNNDGKINIQDQHLLSQRLVETKQTRESLELALSDLSPEPGTPPLPFGDQIIDTGDHARMFEAIMNRDPLNPTLSISSFYKAQASETLTLFGSGFHSVAADNTIIFIGIDGTETAVPGQSVNGNGSQLQVTIPPGLAHPFQIRVDQGTMMSNALTFLLENVPLITSITPDNGEAGDTVTIRGYEFGADPGDNLVLFDGRPAVVQEVTDTDTQDTLVVTIPDDAASGPLTVSVNNTPSNGLAFIYDGAPMVAITSPDENEEVGGQVDILGTASDFGLTEYILELGPVNPDYSVDYEVLASGQDNVNDGVLGTLDTTLLANGFYRIRLTAEDDSGKVSSLSKDILISGENKTGPFTLTLTELEVPMDGIDISVYRIYDSREKSRSRDFGRGWHVEVFKEGTYRNNRPPYEGWDTTIVTWPVPQCKSCSETIDHMTEIRFSDTEFYRFVPVVNTTGAYLMGGYCEGRFEYRQVGGLPGAALEVVGDNMVLAGGGMITDYGFQDYEPRKVRLTTRNGQKVELDLTQGVTKIEDANGNAMTISDSGVTHSSGKTINFTRDGQGRITAITDPAGNSLGYTYNADNTLASSTDRNQNTTTYGYDDFLLTEISDPTGSTPLRNEYDSQGRLVAYVDEGGNRTEIDTNLGNNTTQVTDKMGNVTSMAYNEQGLVTDITTSGATRSATYDDRGNKLTDTDPLGNTTTYTYNDKDLLTSQSDALGHTSSWTYNDMGKILTQTGPRGGVTEKTYDAQGNLLTVTDPLNNVTTHTYDARGNRLTTTDPKGKTTHFAYDTHGNRIQKTDALGHVTTYTYDANGNRVTESIQRTVSGGLVTETTTYTYDGNGNKLTRTDPLGHVTRYEYNHNNRVTKEVDARNRETTTLYDLNGNLVRKDYPDGTFEENVYNLENQRTTQMDRAGRGRFMEYDAQGRITRITHGDGAADTRVYDPAGRMIKAVDPLGNETSHEYDAADRTIKTIDALGNETHFSYDEAGNRISVTDPNNHTTQFEYDANNRLIKTIFPDGSFALIAYDANGNKISETDQAGKTTEYGYDALNRLVSVTDALGHSTSYAYDEVGNRISETDANTNTTFFEYDASGSLIKRILPLGQSESYAYDGVGNMISKTDCNGDTITYEYDDNNRLIRRTLPTLPAPMVETITYTATGKRATETDARGTTLYEYDLRDRLVLKTEPDGTQISYTYDLAGNLTSLTSPSGTTAYDYDAGNRLSQVTAADNGITLYTYDSAGNRAGITFPNANTTEYTYSSLNRLTDMETRTSGGTVIAGFTYTLGPAGNRTRVEESHTGRIIDYTYDDLYRLIQEDITDPVNGNALISYTYDNAGNRLTRTLDGTTTAYAYDDNDRLISETGIVYAYDANGNMVNQTQGSEVTDYIYDLKNRLIEMDTGSVVTDYVYDMKGNRVTTSVSDINGTRTTRYLIDPVPVFTRTLMETDGFGTPKVAYTYGDEIISQTRAGAVSYFHTDGQMSTRLLSDASGTVTDTFAYDAFGRLLAQTGTTKTRHLFTGQFLDPNSGFYYLRARWFSPDTGRFVTSDQFPGSVFEPQTLHKYVYCLNNPVNRMDPGGNFSCVELMTAVSIQQILMTIAPTVLTGIATVIIIETFWDLGFTMRYNGVDMVSLGGPAEFIALGYQLYLGGNALIEMGAFLIDLTKTIIDMTFSFASLATSINGLLNSPRIIVAIANGLITAAAIKDAADKTKAVGESMDTIAEKMLDAPKKKSPPAEVKETSKTTQTIVETLGKLVLDIASKVF